MSEEIGNFIGADNIGCDPVEPVGVVRPPIEAAERAIARIVVVTIGPGGVNPDAITDPNCRIEIVFTSAFKARQMFDALSEMSLATRRRNTITLTDEERAVIEEMRAS